MRLQAAADRAAGKHLDDSRNHGKAGRRPGRPRRQGGRRGDQLRKWRRAGSSVRAGRDPPSCSRRHVTRLALRPRLVRARSPMRYDQGASRSRLVIESRCTRRPVRRGRQDVEPPGRPPVRSGDALAGARITFRVAAGWKIISTWDALTLYPARYRGRSVGCRGRVNSSAPHEGWSPNCRRVQVPLSLKSVLTPRAFGALEGVPMGTWGASRPPAM